MHAARSPGIASLGLGSLVSQPLQPFAAASCPLRDRLSKAALKIAVNRRREGVSTTRSAARLLCHFKPLKRISLHTSGPSRQRHEERLHEGSRTERPQHRAVALDEVSRKLRVRLRDRRPHKVHAAPARREHPRVERGRRRAGEVAPRELDEEQQDEYLVAVLAPPGRAVRVARGSGRVPRGDRGRSAPGGRRRGRGGRCGVRRGGGGLGRERGRRGGCAAAALARGGRLAHPP